MSTQVGEGGRYPTVLAIEKKAHSVAGGGEECLVCDTPGLKKRNGRSWSIFVTIVAQIGKQHDFENKKGDSLTPTNLHISRTPGLSHTIRLAYLAL